MTKKAIKAAPPAATGNAGSQFEVTVGAFYALAMLAEAEPRGLPGAVVKTVKFQQRVQGSPLDDIYVEAENADGTPAYLEIQAKRSLTFTASDKEFADVVGQLWEAASKPDFEAERRELAVAISKTTTRIEHDCQEVLHWAREIGSADTFIANIELKGFGSDGMRSFIDVVRKNLSDIGAPSGNETVWRILRRFQILVFDFEHPGSDFDHRARDRAKGLLPPHQSQRAGDLWSQLAVIVGTNATAAGDRLGRAAVGTQLRQEHGYELTPSLGLREVSEKLKEDALLTLGTIDDQVGGLRLSRSALLDDAYRLLENHRVLHITGAPGTGKSGILKHLARTAEDEGRIIVLRNGRIVGGGWRAMANAYGCQTDLATFLNELGCGGACTVFIDNVDQIDDEKDIATLDDLLAGVKKAPGWRVVTTGGPATEGWNTSLPFAETEIATIDVGDLTDEEAGVLSAGNQTLGLLLAKGHPAEKLARNLFYLARLAQLAPPTSTPISTELDLASLWWRYAGGRGQDARRIARKQTLRAMAVSMIEKPHQAATSVDDLDATTVEELLRLGAIREEIPGATVSFRHDVLRDWVIGFVVAEGRLFPSLIKSGLLPVSLVRGLEMTATIALAEDASGERWRELVAEAVGDGRHASWARPVLLAIPRAAKAYDHLVTNQAFLLADEARLLKDLLRLMLSVDTEAAGKMAARIRPDLPSFKGLSDFVVPKNPGWIAIIVWILAIVDDFPPQVLPEFVRMLRGWLMFTQTAAPALNAPLVAFAFSWLAKIDKYLEFRSYRKGEDVPPPLNVPNLRETREMLQQTVFAFAHINPEAAEIYLREAGRLELRDADVEPLVRLRGSLAKAAPEAYVDLLLKTLIDDEDDEDYRTSHRSMGPFELYDNWFSPPSPAQGPFLELLLADKEQGLRLIDGLITRALRWCARGRPERLPTLSIDFNGQSHEFRGGLRSYMWSRQGVPSYLVASALNALEAWGHIEIENGTPIAEVMSEIMGSKGSSISRLLVAVDLALSHWKLAAPIAWSLVAKALLVSYDDIRMVRDVSGVDKFGQWGTEPNGTIKLADLQARPSRRTSLSRHAAYYALLAPEDERAKFAQAVLTDAKGAVKPANPDDEDLVDGPYAVSRRLVRMIDKENWEAVQFQDEAGNVSSGWQFVPSAEEGALIAARAEEAASGQNLLVMRLTVQNALLKPETSNPEIVTKAVEWARGIDEADLLTGDNMDGDAAFEVRWNHRAIVMAAALAVRDYKGDDPDVKAWAVSTLRGAALEKDDEFRASPQIEYNRTAIAAVGLHELYQQQPTRDNTESLLRLATNWNPAVATALQQTYPRIAKNAPALLRSLMRVTIASSVYVNRRDSSGIDEAPGIEAVIEAELKALHDEAPEPSLPELPPWFSRKRRGLRIGRSFDVEEDEEEKEEPSDLSLNDERVGSLFQGLVPLTVDGAGKWLMDATRHVLEWALDANGRGSEDERDNRPNSFNHQFFDYLGVLSVALPADEVIKDFIEPMAQLPDEAFHSAISDFLVGFDRATLAVDTHKSDNPAAIREAVTRRLVLARNYERTKCDVKLSTETHAASAYKSLFFLTAGFLNAPNPTIPDNWPGLIEVMPTLTDFAVGAPGSAYLASVYLSLIETSPRRDMIPHVTKAVAAWAGVYDSNDTFWLSNNVGGRVVEWLEAAIADTPEMTLARQDIESLLSSLAVLVRLGVTGAPDLELRLAAMQRRVA